MRLAHIILRLQGTSFHEVFLAETLITDNAQTERVSKLMDVFVWYDDVSILEEDLNP